MACNAYNHAPNCPCGFGGDTGGGYWSRAGSGFYGSGPSFGWLSDGGGTVASYVNPNAHCPVCGVPVIFYRSPYNGRVFFNPPLGPPWDKHECKDNGYQPRAYVAYEDNDASAPEPEWKRKGWKPLSHPRVDKRGENTRVRGDVEGDRVEVAVIGGKEVDHGPVFLRPFAGAPGIYEITYLRSDKLTTRERTALAADAAIAKAGRELVRRAAASDPEALAELGRFILYELEQPERARPYLKRALTLGVLDALEVLADLAVIALFGLRDSNKGR
jgi:hypothetical protein